MDLGLANRTYKFRRGLGEENFNHDIFASADMKSMLTLLGSVSKP